MGLLNDLTLGRYERGDSPLHRLDPRVKLCGLPLLVVAAFAGGSPLRLAVLALLAAGLVSLSGVGWRVWWRGVWVLRWLFLFTLLLHLLFSPGRTLWGVAWLSLDGLLLGGEVCARLALAVLFSSLLTLTTPPGEVARSFAALLSPLGRLGLPVRDVAMQLLLVLHFVPVLREEALAVLERFRAEGADPGRGPLVARGRVVGRMLAPLLLRLVDRADALARALAAGEDPVGLSVPLAPFWPPRALDLFALAAGALALSVLFGAL